MAKRKKTTEKRDAIPADFQTVEAAADFWDAHDQTDYEDVSEAVEIKVQIESEETLVSLDPDVTRALEREARRRSVSPETLANLWIGERLSATSKHAI